MEMSLPKRNWDRSLHMWGKRAWQKLQTGWGKRDPWENQQYPTNEEKRAWQNLQVGLLYLTNKYYYIYKISERMGKTLFT